MIKLLGKVPREVVVACSGGVDSVALLHFLSLKHRVKAAFFHHGTENSDRAEDFVEKLCEKMSVKLFVGRITESKPKDLSEEEHWRNCRYEFLSSFRYVVTAHNLDDVAETWVWSSLHGTPKLIPYERGNIRRPLLCTRKKDLIEWCTSHRVDWIEDSSNQDTKYTRNFIRKEMMPQVLRVNPGIHKMLEKKLKEKIVLEASANI